LADYIEHFLVHAVVKQQICSMKTVFSAFVIEKMFDVSGKKPVSHRAPENIYNLPGWGDGIIWVDFINRISTSVIGTIAHQHFLSYNTRKSSTMQRVFR
jgi:hypothetical protein